MNFFIEPLLITEGGAFDDLYAIYVASFPVSEQKSKEELFDMLCSLDYTFFISKTDTKTVGFCIMFNSPQASFYLLEYMAVDNIYRNAKIGSKLFLHAIDQITEKYGEKPCLVEIDSPQQNGPQQSTSERRERFYRKLGCRKVDSFDYILAIKSGETVPPMKLLVYHTKMQNIPKSQLKEWLEDIYMLVYGCSKSDGRIAEMLFGVPQILKLH